MKRLLLVLVLLWPAAASAAERPLITVEDFAAALAQLTGGGSTIITAANYPLTATAGTAGAPSYSFSADGTKGMFSSGTNELSWAIAGNKIFTLFSDTLGILHDVGNLDFGVNRDVELRRTAAGKLEILGATNTMFQFGGATASFPAVKRNAAALNFRLADDSADAAVTAGGVTASGLVAAGGVPTIASGFNAGGAGTVVTNGTDSAFLVTAGTTAVSNTGVVNMVTTAKNGWACSANDLSDGGFVSQVASSTTQASFKYYSRKTGRQINWAASQTISVSCWPR